MNQYPDQVSYELNQYYLQQEKAEENWKMSLPDKKEEIISKAVDVLADRVTSEEFYWIFSEYVVEDYLWDRLDEVITNWHLCDLNDEDEKFLQKAIVNAFEGIVDMLYDGDFWDMVYEGNWNVKAMVEEVING